MPQQGAQSGNGRRHEDECVGARGRIVIARGEHEAARVLGVFQRVGDGHLAGPRMPDDHRARDAERIERRAQQPRLGKRRPERAARAPAVAVAGPVEREHVVALACLIDQAAQLEVLEHAAKPVQQDDRDPESAL